MGRFPDLTRHYDPHQFLGLHGGVIRLWRPGAKEIYLEVRGEIVQSAEVAPGIFEWRGEGLTPLDYRVYTQDGVLRHDPYAFAPGLGEVDAFLLGKGCHYELYRVLGAQVKRHQGVEGVQFSVWAPAAQSVALIADFNHFDGRMNPMRSLGSSGVWELFVPGLQEGEKYKFELRAPDGSLKVRGDPFAFSFEKRPKNASVVFDVTKYAWGDEKWCKNRPPLNGPCLIYELHLGSWKGEAEFPTYREIAPELSRYCQKMGFTHVELLPVMEHPLDESWGYQVSGFFAATSRYGTPADFQFFVDRLHQAGVGVILDWVPAHFPTDEGALIRFDGTALFEHEDPRQGLHPHWQTAIFNYGRKEVSNFLLASALFWLDVMHIDGLRVDAVASMLYLDYGRKAGEWIPNPYGGHHNLEAIEFLKHLNAVVHERFPGRWMIAEESSAFPGVTQPVESGGLGFDLKWNMGWMNDTLRYFSKDPIYRHYHQDDLTFSLLYAFTEKFLLVLSHDEVVHLKRSLLSKMPGPDWQKFANLRLLYSYMVCHPGKKLLFMGGEIAQWNEWDCKGKIEWFLTDYPLHAGMQKMVEELNHLYLREPPLWEGDFDWRGYEWVDFSDRKNCIISYLRRGGNKTLYCLHNFTPEFWPHYRVPLKGVKGMREVFNTDEGRYGGSGKLNASPSWDGEGATLAIAPLATMIFEVQFG